MRHQRLANGSDSVSEVFEVKLTFEIFLLAAVVAPFHARCAAIETVPIVACQLAKPLVEVFASVSIVILGSASCVGSRPWANGFSMGAMLDPVFQSAISTDT